MTDKQVIAARNKILRGLPDLSRILRGSLFERTIRHNSGCPKCERGEGHPLWVLNIVYPGGRTRQLSLRPEQAAQAREWINNYHRLREALEQISECNQALLRNQRESLKSRERSS
jgi:uncharacterized protein DUF6788